MCLFHFLYTCIAEYAFYLRHQSWADGALSAIVEQDLIAAIDNAINALNAAWQTASQQMYQNAGAQPGAGAGQEQGPFYNDQQQSQQNTQKDDNIQDADFEEVK